MQDLPTINQFNSHSLPQWEELEYGEHDLNQLYQQLENFSKSNTYKIFVYALQLEAVRLTDLIIESDESDESLRERMKGEVRALKKTSRFFEEMFEYVSEKINKNSKEEE